MQSKALKGASRTRATKTQAEVCNFLERRNLYHVETTVIATIPSSVLMSHASATMWLMFRLYFSSYTQEWKAV